MSNMWLVADESCLAGPRTELGTLPDVNVPSKFGREYF